MVSLNASPEALHGIAHRAQLNARTDTDWWDTPLDTALAAVSASRHPRAFHADGRAAARRLHRWRNECQVRRISADTVALALAAAAGFHFGIADDDLTADAAEAAADLAQRTDATSPALHVALCAWALDRLVPDRQQRPWPQLRHRMSASSAGRSVYEPLMVLTRSLAAGHFNPEPLVRGLLQSVPTSPSSSDAVILVWALTVALERCAEAVQPDDLGLRALSDRRAELVNRLAHEIDDDSFKSPTIETFDPEGTLDLSPKVYLSPTEALLLDNALASREADAPWLRFEEARALFGQRAEEARRVTAIRTVGLGCTVAALLAATLALGLVLLDVDTAVILCGALTALLFVTGAFWAAWYRYSATRVSEAIGTLLLVGAILSALNLGNQLLSKPVLSDATGLTVGALIPVVVALLVLRSGPPGSRS